MAQIIESIDRIKILFFGTPNSIFAFVGMGESKLISCWELSIFAFKQTILTLH